MTGSSLFRRVGGVAVVLIAFGTEMVVWNGWVALRGGGTIPFLLVPAIAVVVFATLLVRWQRPLLVLAAHWAYALAGALALPNYTPIAGLLVALHAVACTQLIRVGAAVGAACLVVFAVNSVNVADASPPDLHSQALITTGFLWLVLGIGVYGLGRLTYAARQRASLLDQLRVREAAEARQAERLRLARDLHDTVAHGITSIVLQAAVAARQTTDSATSGTFESIRGDGVRAMEELRQMLGLLRDGGAASSLTAAEIPRLVADARGSGMDIELEVSGDPVRLGEDADAAAYRVVQESLTNVRKYASGSATVTVEMRWTARDLVIEVRNTAGSGADLVIPSSGSGLVGLADRVRTCGGRLTATAVETGFVVSARLPFPTTVPTGDVLTEDVPR